jgi:hypothetical protein
LGHLASGGAENMDRVGHAGAIVAVETAWRSHVWSEDVQPQARGALVTLGKLCVTGLDASVPVGTFETDVPQPGSKTSQSYRQSG